MFYLHILFRPLNTVGVACVALETSRCGHNYRAITTQIETIEFRCSWKKKMKKLPCDFVIANIVGNGFESLRGNWLSSKSQKKDRQFHNTKTLGIFFRHNIIIIDHQKKTNLINSIFGFVEMKNARKIIEIMEFSLFCRTKWNEIYRNQYGFYWYQLFDRLNSFVFFVRSHCDVSDSVKFFMIIRQQARRYDGADLRDRITISIFVSFKFTVSIGLFG